MCDERTTKPKPSLSCLVRTTSVARASTAELIMVDWELLLCVGDEDSAREMEPLLGQPLYCTKEQFSCKRKNYICFRNQCLFSCVSQYRKAYRTTKHLVIQYIEMQWRHFVLANTENPSLLLYTISLHGFNCHSNAHWISPVWTDTAKWNYNIALYSATCISG